jgi:predicted GNAT family N-acyltransferase
VTARLATAADWPAVAALRTRVFVEEQGVPAEIEQDAHDATAVHALAEDREGRVVATGRLLVRDGRAAGATAPPSSPSCTGRPPPWA